MICYELPTSLNIKGVEYAIRTDFRAILDILIACNDSDLDTQGKGIVMLKILFVDWDKLPLQHIEEACRKACDFIDCGQKDDGKLHPKMIDWEQDAAIIIPAVNNVAHTEVRAVPYLHWWTFLGYFMEIRESMLSSVIHIRQKKSKHKKLEKWEQEFYNENRDIVDFKSSDSKEIRKEKDNLLKWL